VKKRKAITNIAGLLKHNLIAEEDLPVLEQVAARFNIAITPAILEILSGPDAPAILNQFLPKAEELEESTQELSDPTGDNAHEKVKGLIHRYPDRCLLKVASSCPVYCRFCFRKEMIGAGKKSLSAEELETAYRYINNHPEIWEVILTGGDPFMLNPARIKAIISVLNDIPHVEVIRLHTRIPVVDPGRVTLVLVNALKSPKAVYVALHANHPAEFTQEAIAACKMLVDAGIPMLSQSVLLKGVNDSVEVLSQLMKTFVRNRIKPYYLHHPDLAKGTDHFRPTIQAGQTLMKALQGRFSGLCQPMYVLDIPGGYGKTPLGPCYAHPPSEACQAWVVEDYQGNRHDY
jgi:lysine 2,3-aminomutase